MRYIVAPIFNCLVLVKLSVHISLQYTGRACTCKVDQTAAVSTVTTRLFSARVQQLATVAEEPCPALTVGIQAVRCATIATLVVAGRAGGRSPPLVTTTQAATRRRPTLSSIMEAAVTNQPRSWAVGTCDFRRLLLLLVVRWNYASDAVGVVNGRRWTALTEAQIAERMFVTALIAAYEQTRRRDARYNTHIYAQW